MIWLSVICVLCVLCVLRGILSIVLSLICMRFLRNMDEPMRIHVIFNDETDVEYTVFGKATIVDGGIIVMDDEERAVTLPIGDVRTWEVIDG